MKILSDLYVAAEALQSDAGRDWHAFARRAADLTDAGLALYRARFSPGGRVPDSMEFIASSHPDIVQAYSDARIWQHNAVPETEMAPLEPVRRTDLVSDDEFAQLGPLFDFFDRHGMHYQLGVPAVLNDGAILGLFLWRGAGQRDFDDLEKQRLALFMRHLLVVFQNAGFDAAPDGPGTEPDEGLAAFGRRHGLTPAEQGILAGLLDGLSLRQIAERSERSYGTVRWHVRNILDKCHVGSQKDLLREFYGLIRH